MYPNFSNYKKEKYGSARMKETQYQRHLRSVCEGGEAEGGQG